MAHNLSRLRRAFPLSSLPLDSPSVANVLQLSRPGKYDPDTWTSIEEAYAEQPTPYTKVWHATVYKIL